ncbi:hypothetical protein HGRIS_004347 [Hohenbuehelia grisea]|uniref:ABC transmembrane type-1 domain-containing protein n=1 Tax=Hohenbuehelia grisea TaxID=104357 RepID=A0ABR3IPI1_9AGAR
MVPAPTPAMLMTFTLRIVSPTIVLLASISLIAKRPSSPLSSSSITSVIVATRISRRAGILSCLTICGFTFFRDGMTAIIAAVVHRSWQRSDNGLIFNTIVGLASFSSLAVLGAWNEVVGADVWSLQRVKYAFAFALLSDTSLAVLLGLQIKVFPPCDRSASEVLHLTIVALRILALIPLLYALLHPRNAFTSITIDASDESIPTASLPLSESAEHSFAGSPSVPLLSTPSTPGASTYGTFANTSTLPYSTLPTTNAPSPANNGTDIEDNDEPVTALDPSWSATCQRIGRILPHLFPRKRPSLQALGFVCIFILLIDRVVNVALPYSLGALVHVFEGDTDKSPWLYLAEYIGLFFLQGSGGLAALRDAAWAPVRQYSDREVSILSFNHLLGLPWAFHTQQKTGEIQPMLDRARTAIGSSLELLIFNMVPTCIDILVALVVFCLKFDWTLGLIIFVFMVAYVTASVVLTNWKAKLHRKMTERDLITPQILADCLLNYDAIEFFNGEEHEATRYRDAYQEYQVSEREFKRSLSILRLVLGLILCLELLTGSTIAALRVVNGEIYPSDFVMFITYLAQLLDPLDRLGSFYQAFIHSLVHTENLFKLLAKPTDVKDRNPPGLTIGNGEIVFENVSFSYDGLCTALSEVSFKVPEGSSVALVGASGSGKTTIFRLLCGSYTLDNDKGRILIGGQDIRNIPQSQLMELIGVVSQNPALFDESIGYNIGYGKFGSSPEEIKAAAMSASMHDRIMSFPKGYNTEVGGFGAQLSGGERQRIAIARMLLKDPRIVCLDEATRYDHLNQIGA